MKKIIKAGNGEFIDKKSRFIAYICNIESEEQAVKIISEIKKKYWDADIAVMPIFLETIMKCRDFLMTGSRQGQQANLY